MVSWILAEDTSLLGVKNSLLLTAIAVATVLSFLLYRLPKPQFPEGEKRAR